MPTIWTRTYRLHTNLHMIHLLNELHDQPDTCTGFILIEITGYASLGFVIKG